ncbi:protein IWS1 homolog [Watersipora subatra]|uniref:protein IWS1 homolog n=1 Tax=Watersipora subatra TaxID=2589382 RepID=UPI00355C9B26
MDSYDDTSLNAASTSTPDDPASPDPEMNDDVAKQPASPDSDTHERSASPSGSVTPTLDETGSRDSYSPIVLGNPTLTQDELDSNFVMQNANQTEGGSPQSPTVNRVPTDDLQDGPQSPPLENSLEGPESPSFPDTAASPEMSQSRESSPRLDGSEDERSNNTGPNTSEVKVKIKTEDNAVPEKESKRVHSSDSEEEETHGRKRLDSSESENETPTPTKKKRRLDSDDSGEESDGNKDESPQSPEEAADKEGDGDVIADIFGDSSDEEAEFQGFDEAEIKSAEVTEAVPPEVSSDDEVEDERTGKGGIVSDFDLMMEQKKAERASGRRKKRNVDIINDNDDLIVEMLKKMKDAAEEDRVLNQNHQPATRKLTMLPLVTRQLNKAELQTAFMDCGVLAALTEWLAPLPDKSLPHLSIRQNLLKILSTLPHPHTDQLKSSGIGKAIMYLFKHPKELRANRDIAGRLINEWSRPIFGQSSNFQAVNRDDLQRRDMKTLKSRRRSSEDTAKQEEEQRGLRPGDPGWIYRARVPRPSNKDYVVRPESNVDSEAAFSKNSSKKKKTRYEKQKQKMDNKKKAMKAMTAVKISIEGNKMSL